MSDSKILMLILLGAAAFAAILASTGWANRNGPPQRSALASDSSPSPERSPSRPESPKPTAPDPRGEWIVKTETSPIDDSTNVYLYLPANEEIPATLGTIRPTMVVRCKEDHTDVFVNWGVYLGLDETRVLHRFDKLPAKTRTWNISTDREATFYRSSRGAVEMVRAMMEHDKLLLQVTPYGESPAMVTFDLRGLTDAVIPLREACHWSPQDLARREEQRAAVDAARQAEIDAAWQRESERTKAKAAELARQAATVRQWWSDHRETVTALRLSLGGTLDAATQGDAEALRATCPRLDIARDQASGQSFQAAPDPEVERGLQALVEGLGYLITYCEQGRVDAARSAAQGALAKLRHIEGSIEARYGTGPA